MSKQKKIDFVDALKRKCRDSYMFFFECTETGYKKTVDTLLHSAFLDISNNQFSFVLV